MTLPSEGRGRRFKSCRVRQFFRSRQSHFARRLREGGLTGRRAVARWFGSMPGKLDGSRTVTRGGLADFDGRNNHRPNERRPRRAASASDECVSAQAAARRLQRAVPCERVCLPPDTRHRLSPGALRPCAKGRHRRGSSRRLLEHPVRQTAMAWQGPFTPSRADAPLM